MKNIDELLSGVGLAVPDEQKNDFQTAFLESYTPKADFDKLTAERDSYQSRFETALKDLKAKEQEYNEKLAERDFNDLISRCAGDFKARDIKAVMPFLDVEQLRKSNHQSDDVRAAFETVKKDKPYLFEDDSVPRVVSFTSGTSTKKDLKTKANEALRSFLRKD